MTTDAQRWREFGALVRAERRRAGLRLIDLDGGSESKWSRIETAKRPPSFQDAQFLAQRLQCKQILEAFVDATRVDGLNVKGPQDVQLVGIDTRHDVLELNTTVEVRDDGATLIERRVIRSNVDGLDRLTLRAGLLRSRGELPSYSNRALDGCTSAGPVVEVTPSYLLVPLDLSRTLDVGDETEFRVEWRLSSMPPRYTYSPLVGTRTFTTRITFRTEQPPLNLYRFDGVTSTIGSVSVAASVGLPRVELDRDRSVFGRFEQMRHGLAYGYVWQMFEGDDFA